MASKTIKFDVENALIIHQKIETINKKTEEIILSCEKEYNNSLNYFKGKSRKTYDEETIELFSDFKTIIQDTSNMIEIIQDVSKNFLDFDITNAKMNK